mgnify:CR=1 FL=1
MSNKSIFFKIELSKLDSACPMNPEIRILAKHDGTFCPMTAKIVESELDKVIDRLITELESIRKEAKRKFAAAKPGRG